MDETPLTFGSDFRLWRCVEHRGDRSRCGRAGSCPKRLRRRAGWRGQGRVEWWAL